MNAKSKNHLTKARNLVRGALSQLRELSKPDAVRDGWRQEQLAQQQINKALAIATRNMSRGELASFEHWVTNSMRDLHKSGTFLGAPLTSLGLLPADLSARDLVTELHLAIERLQDRSTELCEFAQQVVAVAEAIRRRDWLTANMTLQVAIKRHQYSYWAVETELALKQLTQGVEALKAHIGSMSICANGVNRFLLYFFGVRNEPAQASSRFRANLKRKIEESDLSADLQAYSKFRLYGALESSSIPLAKVIACERLTTVIDLLFTTLKVCSLVTSRPTAFSSETTQAVERAGKILGPVAQILGVRAFGATLPEGENIPAERRRLQIAGKAAALALAPLPAWNSDYSDDGIVIRGLASQLSTRNDGVAAEELAKELLNLSWLPIAMELGDISLIPSLPSFFIGAIDESSQHEGSMASLETIFNLKRVEFLDELTVSKLRPFASVRAARAEGRDQDAIELLKAALKQESNEIARDGLLVVLAHELFRGGAMQECLEVCAEAGLSNERLVALLPLVSMFQGIKWSALSQLGPSVDLAIALDHSLRVVDDRKIRTYKRYAIDELLNRYVCATVVDLPSALIAAGVDVRKVEHFFDQVCDVFSMELLPGMGESKKVQLARSQILRFLSTMHTRRELSYLAEATEIEERLQVDDGLYVLDDSKVYVDEQTVLNFVNQDLGADFQRYLKLVESGIGVSESINEVIRGFNNPSAKTFQIPKNDADDLLTQMVGAILQRFIFDPACGLDIIIGRRIRHGTISGELRGVLEKLELIGHKPRAGASYNLPPKIDRLSGKMDARQLRIVNAASSRFSESIDQLIALLRDEYFHVISISKPRGIFELVITPVMLAMARSLAQTCHTIEQFSKECVQLFWFVLSLRVTVARPTVEAEIKKTLQTIFAKFSNELRALNFGDANFFFELQQAADELQRRASTISSWVRIPKIDAEVKSYSLKQVVDVAVAVVTGQRPGFKPIIKSKVPENLELETHGFSIVSDAMYIALDNIAHHSGKKVNNNVSIDITFNQESSLISFEITNEVVPSARGSEKEGTLNEIRLNIQKRAYGERVRQDRHSGLFKLAALVAQSEKTTMSFGYIGTDKFQLKFDLVYVALSSATAHSALASIESLPTEIQAIATAGLG